jgi:ketosteroid isomerase-like protein
MIKRIAVAVLMLGLVATATAKSASKAGGAAGVDRAYLEKIWAGWATLDAAGQKQFYAQGPHVFFDIAPVKYSNWDEYQVTVAKDLANYKAAKFVINDDLQIHKAGDIFWITTTIASDMTQKSGKREMTTFRWTAIFEKQDAKWLITHEHVSMSQE